MPKKIIVPVEKRVICSADESYSLPIAIIAEYGLTPQDEELIDHLALFTPRTAFKEGDFVFLEKVPEYIRRRFLSRGQNIVPRTWKVRFVITRWALDLISVASQHGGTVSVHRAMEMLQHRAFQRRDAERAMIFAHGYPHGEYPDSAEWIPERYLRKTIFKEHSMPWTEIVQEAGAEYLGYDAASIPTRFTLDLAPDNYADGQNIGHPFRAEEPLVNTLYESGAEEMLKIPFFLDRPGQGPSLDPEHDILYRPASRSGLEDGT